MIDSKNRKLIVIYCGFLLSISAFSIDITLPLFLQISAQLQVSLPEMAQTVTVFIACMGAGQFVFGPLSDRVGRRVALLVGLSIFLLGAALALFASSFSLLLFARGLQGFGGAVAPVVARAIVRDLYSGRELARAMALATGIFSIGPIVGPLLGGTLASVGGDWRIVFIGMFVYVLVLLLGLIRLPETLAEPQLDALKPATLMRNTRRVLSNQQSRFYLFISTTMLTSMILIVSLAQPIYASEFGVTGLTFALLFAIHGTGIIIGQIINHRLIDRLGEVRTAICAAVMTTTASTLILVFSWMQWINAAWLTFFIFLFAIGFLAVLSTSISLVLGPHGPIAGFTASLHGAVSQIGAGVFAATISSFIPVRVGWWGMALAVVSFFVLVCLLWEHRRACVHPVRY